MAHTRESPKVERRGSRLVQIDLATTAMFLVLQTVAVVRPNGAALAASVIFSLAMFTAGSAAFLTGFLISIGRSRDEPVSMAGLVWVVGVAPVLTARNLRGAVVAQVSVAICAAAVRPFTPVAFGILAPMAGLGALALWSGRHGEYGLPSMSLPENLSASKVDDSVAADDDSDDFDQLFRWKRRGSRS